jgi:Icc-related predicted phosphoesterase
MKLQVFSDLHLDVASIKPITVGADVDAVVVAGDTCQGVRNSFIALRRIVPEQIPVIMVAGNHEFYRHCIMEEIEEGREIAGDFNIAFLEDDVRLITARGTATRFVAASLWTNYRVFGAANAATAMDAARRNMNDHRVITWTKKPWARFRPEEALLKHERSKSHIAEILSTPFAGSTVVVTHHAPHFGSVAKGPYESDILTAAYVSDLSDVIMTGAEEGADSTPKKTTYAKWDRLWIHAHIHSSSDYVVGTTRILANPHGYGTENSEFDPQLTIEIGS